MKKPRPIGRGFSLYAPARGRIRPSPSSPGTAAMNALRASVIALSLLAFTLEAREATPPTAKLVSAKPGDPPAVELSGLDKRTLTAIAEAKLTADEWAKVARLVVDSGT